MVLLGNIGWPPTITVAARAGAASASVAANATVFRALDENMTCLLRVKVGFASRGMPKEGAGPSFDGRRDASSDMPARTRAPARLDEGRHSQDRDGCVMTIPLDRRHHGDSLHPT